MNIILIRISKSKQKLENYNCIVQNIKSEEIKIFFIFLVWRARHLNPVFVYNSSNNNYNTNNNNNNSDNNETTKQKQKVLFFPFILQNFICKFACVYTEKCSRQQL